MSTDTPPPAAPVKEDSTVAILSYITIIGFIVAIILHGNKKTSLGSFHLRQALGLNRVDLIAGNLGTHPGQLLQVHLLATSQCVPAHAPTSSAGV